MVRRKKGGASQSWARARRLNELAGVGTITSARSFIAEQKEHFPEYIQLLDGRADKRNKRVREMISEYGSCYKKWS